MINQKKNHKVVIPMSYADKERIKFKAQQARMSLSEFGRFVLLGAELNIKVAMEVNGNEHLENH